MCPLFILIPFRIQVSKKDEKTAAKDEQQKQKREKKAEYQSRYRANMKTQKINAKKAKGKTGFELVNVEPSVYSNKVTTLEIFHHV